MIVGDGSGPRSPVGVVSAVVGDDRKPGRLLLCVRRPSPLSPRFPGVLSTPTMRLSPDTFALLSAAYPDPCGAPGSTAIDGPERTIGRGGHLGSLEALVLEDLFLRKLVPAEALVGGHLSAVARARYLSLDEVADPLGTGVGEWTAMLTYEVRLRDGVDQLPRATAGYSRLVWVDAAAVPLALARHDALLLDETLDATEVCIQGMCVRVAQLLTG